MLIFSTLMFVTAALFLVLAVCVYRGNTKLIHSYHQTKVKASDQKAYGKAFAKGLFSIAFTLFTSGIASLFGKDHELTAMIVAVLLIGLTISFAILWIVQKKYNGGLF